MPKALQFGCTPKINSSRLSSQCYLLDTFYLTRAKTISWKLSNKNGVLCDCIFFFKRWTKNEEEKPLKWITTWARFCIKNVQVKLYYTVSTRWFPNNFELFELCVGEKRKNVDQRATKSEILMYIGFLCVRTWCVHME